MSTTNHIESDAPEYGEKMLALPSDRMRKFVEGLFCGPMKGQGRNAPRASQDTAAMNIGSKPQPGGY